MWFGVASARVLVHYMLNIGRMQSLSALSGPEPAAVQ